MKFKVILYHDVVDENEEHSGSKAYWTNIGDATLAQLIGLSNKAFETVRQKANMGGPLSITMTREVLVYGGKGPVPQDANGSQRFDGITDAALVEIQAAAQVLGAQLQSMGKTDLGVTA